MTRRKTELIGIQQTAYPSANSYNKTHFHRAVQELFVTRRLVSVGEQTTENFRQLLEKLQERLAELTAALAVEPDAD